MQYLISFPCPSSQKVQYWKNASKHYCGDHSMCMKHKPSSFTWELKGNDEAVRALKDFLKNTAFILSQCQMPYSTQLNECYNSMKSHFLDKEIAWRRTAFARLCCAILDFNEVPNWRLILRTRLNLPDLTPNVIVRINEFEKKRLKFLFERRQIKYQTMERLRRFEERNESRKQDTSGYTGKPKIHIKVFFL